MRRGSAALPLGLLTAFLTAFVPTGPAAAQVGAVVVRSPRPFGIFIGDRFTAEVEIEAAEAFSPQAASLPKPGPLNAWLDLAAVALATPGPERGGRRYWRLALTYQSFYAALDARQLDVPGFTVAFADGRSATEAGVVAEVPGWSVGVSPLREVHPPPVADPAAYLRPESSQPRRDPAPLARSALVFAALALAGLALLAHDRAWGPFRRRNGRAFAAAWRQVRRLAGRSDPEAAYREALLALHRGLDATDRRRVLGEDLGGFLDRHPAYAPLTAPLARFFVASHAAFFGRDPAAARRIASLADVAATVRQLAAAERGGASVRRETAP